MNVLAQLKNVGDALDERGLHAEADVVDTVITRLAELDNSDLLSKVYNTAPASADISQRAVVDPSNTIFAPGTGFESPQAAMKHLVGLSADSRSPWNAAMSAHWKPGAEGGANYAILKHPRDGQHYVIREEQLRSLPPKALECVTYRDSAGR